MHWNNIEIKAYCSNPTAIRDWLQANHADYKGLDHQIDTYFKVPYGRLKLREGNIECALIHYHRPNQAGPKHSDIRYYKPQTAADLKQTLEAALGILVVVDKQRHIYFIDNVKFHVDEVQGLGAFVEIEAIDREGTLGLDHLQAQCAHYQATLGIAQGDLIAVSYSDLLLEQRP